ncbi:MAG: hypothetical protein KJP00_10920 [Bacteroidia bacterium]|nr:hypothetical protein [Bacteroidia bacterium]
MALISYCSCGKTNEDPNILYNLDEEFSLRPTEYFQSGNKVPSLVFTSIKSQPCEQAAIEYQYRFVNDIALIQIIDITKPSNCPTAVSYPYVDIPLTPGNLKVRKIKIEIKEILENTGELWDNGDHYQLLMHNSDGLTVTRNILYKVPDYAIWGAIDYAKPGYRSIADQFISDVSNLGTTGNYDTGYYGHFEVTEDADIQVFLPHSREHRSAFLIRSEEDLSVFQSLINQYRTDYPLGLDFHIHTFEGDIL